MPRDVTAATEAKLAQVQASGYRVGIGEYHGLGMVTAKREPDGQFQFAKGAREEEVIAGVDLVMAVPDVRWSEFNLSPLNRRPKCSSRARGSSRAGSVSRSKTAGSTRSTSRAWRRMGAGRGCWKLHPNPLRRGPPTRIKFAGETEYIDAASIFRQRRW